MKIQTVLLLQLLNGVSALPPPPNSGGSDMSVLTFDSSFDVQKNFSPKGKTVALVAGGIALTAAAVAAVSYGVHHHLRGAASKKSHALEQAKAQLNHGGA